MLLPRFDPTYLAHDACIVAGATSDAAAVAGGITAWEQARPTREPGR